MESVKKKLEVSIRDKIKYNPEDKIYIGRLNIGIREKFTRWLNGPKYIMRISTNTVIGKYGKRKGNNI